LLEANGHETGWKGKWARCGVEILSDRVGRMWHTVWRRLCMKNQLGRGVGHEALWKGIHAGRVGTVCCGKESCMGNPLKTEVGAVQ